MKKNILFVIPSLSVGGGEKSLVNLLLQIDYDLYNVDLFLFSRKGAFMKLIPEEVNVLEFPKNYKIFSLDLMKSIKIFSGHGQIYLAYSRLMFAIKNRLIRDTAISEQYTWRYLNQSFDVLEREYDVAIGYLEKSSIYLVVNKVKSKKKIGWIHTNYSDSGMDYRFDNPYFEQLDHIVTVSEECAKSLKESFIHLKNKINVIYNVVSPRIICRLSHKETQDDFGDDKNYINIITIARLSYEKGIDITIKSCELLVNRGYEIKWYVLGDGNERQKLETLIRSKGLKNNFILLGVKENPYPYIRKSDIYVQPSRYEGKSIAIDEAKILHKPIIITNFETAKNHLDNGVDGMIVGMNEEEISFGIEKLIKDKDFKNNLIANLSSRDYGTEDEINKLYKIF